MIARSPRGEGRGRRVGGAPSRRWLLIAFSAVALAGASGAAPHGDPAVHYLEGGALHTSFARPPAQALELQLLGLLQASDQRGYPIKVALIASRDDIPDDPKPFGSPQRYAEFVSSQLELVDRLIAPVLIVTPAGVGVSGRQLRDGRLLPVRRADAPVLLRGVEVPPRAEGDALARAAMLAVRRLARAGGLPLPAHVPPAQAIGPDVVSAGSGGGRSVDMWLVAALLGSLPLVGGLLYVARKVPKHTPPND